MSQAVDLVRLVNNGYGDTHIGLLMAHQKQALRQLWLGGDFYYGLDLGKGELMDPKEKPVDPAINLLLERLEIVTMKALSSRSQEGHHQAMSAVHAKTAGLFEQEGAALKKALKKLGHKVK